MELLYRYRNLSILVIVILAQLVLLAYQVKTSQDVRLIRVWAVTAVTPLARVLEGFRSSTFGFVRDYLVLSGAQAENRRMKQELGSLKLENQYLKSELATAQRAEALQAFQKRSPSKTLAARVIGTSTGTNSKVVFVDRGSTSGVMRGMAVLTPDGIIGKVVASYPTAAQVQLITDPTFAAGVLSQKNKVTGTLKGQGRSDCIVDYVQIEQPVEVGEWFYTSGDDRVFPKGLPVGQVTVVRPGKIFKEIYLVPAGFQRGLDEVLIVVEGVHQQIPSDPNAATGGVSLLPPPPQDSQSGQTAAISDPKTALTTDADRLKQKYREIGQSQNYKFGEGMASPDFNKPPVPKPAQQGPSESASPIKPPTSTVPAPQTRPETSTTPAAPQKPVVPLAATPKPPSSASRPPSQ